MKQFPLLGLMRLRDVEEKQAAAELAEANRSLNSIHARRLRMQADLSGTSVEATSASHLAAIATARASASTMLAELGLLHDRAKEAQTIAKASHQVSKSRAVALEKLSNRHVAAETAADLRTEQKALDEIAIGAWNRKAFA